MYNIRSQQLQANEPPNNQYNQQQTQATLNLSSMFQGEQFRQILPQKCFSDFCYTEPPYPNCLLEFQKFVTFSMKNYQKNNRSIPNLQVQMTLLIERWLNSVNVFKTFQLDCKIVFGLVLKEFCKVHLQLKKQNAQIFNIQNKRNQGKLTQEENDMIEIAIKSSRQYYRSLDKIKIVWKRYYHSFLDTNKAYIKVFNIAKQLINQYCLYEIQKHPLMEYKSQKQFYKNLNIEKQKKNIQVQLILYIPQLRKTNKTEFKNSKEVLNKLKEDMKTNLDHQSFCKILNSVMQCTCDKILMFDKEITNQYIQKIEYLLQKLRKTNENIKTILINLHRNIDVMLGSSSTQQIKKFVQNVVENLIKKNFQELNSIFQILSNVTKQFNLQIKDFQTSYLWINQIFNENENKNFYGNKSQKQFIKKTLKYELFNVGQNQCSDKQEWKKHIQFIKEQKIRDKKMDQQIEKLINYKS